MTVMENKNENRKYCVYVHISPSGKMYVGQTGVGIEKRWGKDGAGYLLTKDGKYTQPAFAHAIIKYGWDNFQHEIVANNLTKEEADNFEKLLIEKLNTMNPSYGYNLRSGGSDGCFTEDVKQRLKEINTGRIVSEETKRKLSEAHKGFVPSEETRKKLSEMFSGEGNPFYGKRHSEESLKKMSNAHKGYVPSEEARRKMSEAISGEKHYLYGKHRSEDTKRKLSEAHKGLQAGAKHPRARKVAQYDLQGNLVKVWDYTKEAGKELRINYHNIHDCCKGNRRTCGGYIWRYYEDEITDEYLSWCNEVSHKTHYKSPVAQYSLAGEFIQVFESMKIAELKTSVKTSSISDCCRGKKKTAGGFIWKYYEECDIAEVV